MTTNYRSKLEKEFDELNIGQLEEIHLMSDDDLGWMVAELSEAQRIGELDIETDAGIANLERIVSKYMEKL